MLKETNILCNVVKKETKQLTNEKKDMGKIIRGKQEINRE